jgi:acetyl-CoA acetyltransferase
MKPTADGIFDAARIVGVHTTKPGRSLAPRTGISVALEALRGALDDAGMSFEEIDGICSDVTDWPNGESGSVEMYWARQLGHPIRWYAEGVLVNVVLDAMAAIEKGHASTVAIVSGRVRPTATGVVPKWARPNNEFTEWTGSYTTVQYALPARRYLHEFGPRALQAMAEASAVIRNYGTINPAALYHGHGPYTAEDVLASRMIADPLTLLMCSSVNDGGSAIIITNKQRAARASKKPIQILAGGIQWPYALYYDAPVLNFAEDVGAFARDAMQRAGVTHADIDILELYDNFSIGVLLSLELFGFCGPGEASDWVLSGNMRIDGRYPTCTDGGAHAHGHNGNPALDRIIEAVRQLRGEIPDACPDWAAGIHTGTPGVCRAARDPEIAFVGNPGTPTGGGGFAVLAHD